MIETVFSLCLNLGILAAQGQFSTREWTCILGQPFANVLNQALPKNGPHIYTQTILLTKNPGSHIFGPVFPPVLESKTAQVLSRWLGT